MKMMVMLAFGVLFLSAMPAGAALPSSGERLAAPCGTCHGTRGASPGTHIPVIGGQNADYLKKTMKSFRDGTRPGGVMANLSKGYSEQQLDEIAVAVSSWKWQNSPHSVGKKKEKRTIAGVESCAACHGKRGEGTQIAPRISGQPAGYLKEALNEYRTGRRPAVEMGLVKGLSEQDIDRYAAYFSVQK